MIDVPAIVMTRLGDPVASNPLGRALFPDLFPAGKPALNSARYMFLDERSRVFYPDWETTALEAVWWGGHTVRIHSTGIKHIHHPVVGDMTLGYEALDVTSTPGLVLMTYLAEPATPSADAMNMLRSWAAQPLDATNNATATSKGRLPVVPVIEGRTRSGGSIAAISGLVANLTAWEAMRILLGLPLALSGQVRELDLFTLDWRVRKLARHDCGCDALR